VRWTLALLVLLVLISCGGNDKPTDAPKKTAAPTVRGPHVVWDGASFHCSRANDCRGTLGATLEIQGVEDKTLVTIGREPPVTTTITGASIPLTVASFADADPAALAAAPTDGTQVMKVPLAITTGDTVLYTTGAPVLLRTAAAIVDEAFARGPVAAFPATGHAIWIAESALGGGAVGLVGAATKVSDIDRVVARSGPCEVVMRSRTTQAELARAPICERAAIEAWAAAR
jgi:hypothetical protein